MREVACSEGGVALGRKRGLNLPSEIPMLHGALSRARLWWGKL